MKKKLIALLCVAVMSVNLMVGCGTSVDENVSSSENVENTVTSESTQKEVVEKPTELKQELPISTEGITFKVAFPVSAKVEDITTNKLTTYIEEQTGINLEFIELSTADAATQINTIMNGEDLPDIILGYNFPYDVLCSYADAGLLLPLDEYIDTWGYNLKNVIFADPDLGEESMSFVTYDDHVYSLPTGGAMVTDRYAKYPIRIQMHFLEELGMELPKTIDQFRAYLEAVKENYPDVIPLTSSANANHIFTNLSQAWQYTDEFNYLKVTPEGKIEFIANNEEFKAALEYVKGMMDDGLIDPAAFTQDEAVLSTILAKDGYNVGALANGYRASNVCDTAGEEFLNFNLIGTLEGPNGYCSSQLDKVPIVASMVMTSACEYPEEAFRLFDFFLSDEFAATARLGFEGEQWEKAAEGAVGRDGKQAWYNLLTTQEWVQPMTNVIWRNAQFCHGTVMNHVQAELTPYAAAVQINEQDIPAKYKGEKLPELVMDAELMTEYNELRNLIIDAINTNIANFIMGNRDLAEYDAYCEELNKMNVERYIELAQDAYDLYLGVN